MNKIKIFDADGVLILPRKQLFSERLSIDYGISPEIVIPLFKNEFYKCVLGELDLKEVLQKYIPLWGFKGSVDELLKYWWKEEEMPNHKLLSEIDSFRQKGIKCFMATDQEKYRAEHLMNIVGLSKHLDGVFFSCNLHLSKSSEEFWIRVLESLGNPNPKNVEFYDDEQENIDASLSVGIDAKLFKF